VIQRRELLGGLIHDYDAAAASTELIHPRGLACQSLPLLGPAWM
jgi:hypothetical protein